MKRLIQLINILLLLGCVLTIQGQSQNLNFQLANLKSALDRTAVIVRLLPDFPDNDVKTKIETKLREAQQNYQDAVEFAGSGQTQKAQLLIKQSYLLLKEIELLIKQHPIFKIKFQEQLDRRIQQAEEAVRFTQNEEALYMLERAKFFRRQAYSLFRQGRTYRAVEYYRLALHFSNQTLKILGVEGGFDRSIPNEDSWRNFYLDTQMLLERAQNVLENSNRNNQFKNMLERAETEMQDAVRLYEKKDYDAAKRKLQAINRALYRIIDVAENIPQQENDRLRMDLESLQFSLQSIKDKMSDAESPALKKLYDRTENLTFQIQQHIEQNQPVLARRKMFFANQLVLRMYQMAEKQPDNQPQEIENRIIMTRRDVDELKEQETNSPDSGAMLRLIEENLGNAEITFDKKEYLSASQYLTITNRLILKYNRLQLPQPQEEIQAETVRQDLQRLSDLLERLKTSDEKTTESAIRYRNAEELYNMANQAFERNEWYLCQELTTMAINLLTK